MELIRNNIVEGDETRGIDRLTRLPPELVGNIYHHLSGPSSCSSCYSRRFLPVAKPLLHFQRENLYGSVELWRPDLIGKFCQTIIGSTSLAEMVKDLVLGEWMGWNSPYIGYGDVIDYKGQEYSASEMGQLLRSALPRLTHLERLEIPGRLIAGLAFASFIPTSVPSSLTSLDLDLQNDSVIDGILARFPALLKLCLRIFLHDTFEASAVDRIPLHPPRRLTTLSIHADYRSQPICNLIASTESTETILEGAYTSRGLASLRNSEVMRELTVECSSEEENLLDQSLLKLTNLTKLSLGGEGSHVSDRFFTDYFKPELPLQFLHLRSHFTLESSDFIRALESKPIALKSLVLNTLELWINIHTRRKWSRGDWRQRGFDDEEMEEIIEIYTKGGVEVSGSDLKFIQVINGKYSGSEIEWTSSEEEDEEEEDSSSEEEDEEEQHQSEDDDEVGESEDEETVHGVDRLSILPPNLIGVVYDNLASDADHHFRPIVRSLLHSQLNNLYRRVEFTSKLRFAKFCRTLSGVNGNELGRMVKAMLLDSLSIEGGAGDDEAGIGSAQRKWEAMVIEGQVQLILPKLTRLRTFQVHRTAPASRPVIPFFSSPTSSPSSSTITTLRLELEDYCLIHLILPLFPNLLNLALVLLSPASELEMDPTTPVAPLDSTTQPRHLDRLIIGGDFIVPSLCSIVASTEATFTTLFGHTMHSGLLALKNSERMKSLMIYCDDEWEDTEDHGQALVNFTNVKKLILGWRIRVEHSFFSDLFESIPRMESLSLMDGFPLVALDLISAIETNPIVGLRLELDFIEFEGVEKTGVACPGGCQAEGVRAIIVACEAAADMVVTGSTIDIVKRLDELVVLGESDHD